jgi:outer membrane protein OmpA-like peptidoglycan-associated protein
MFKIKKKSGWTWVTSEGGSAGAGPVALASGSFTLQSPTGGAVAFKYKSAGVSVSVGGKVNLSGSTTDTFSTGQIYITETFPKGELTSRDIEGFCLTQDASVGAGLGGSVTAMLLGIPATSVPQEMIRNTGALGVGLQLAVDHPSVTKVLLGPLGGYIFDKVKDPLDKILQSDAKALLLMGGFNAGPQLSAGISGSLGYVSAAPIPDIPVLDLTGPEEIVVKTTAQDDSIIHIPGDVLFDFDKSDLKPDAKAALGQVASLVRAKSPHRISVEGHTDSIGSAAYNIGLSNRRARSVAQWLTANKVAKASDLTTKGWGESKPIQPNKKPNGSDNAAGRARNRRVEIWLLK